MTGLPPDTGIAVLAAGAASRFGADKLGVDLLGKPLGAWALEAAERLAVPTVVIARSRPAFLAPDGALQLEINPSAEDGIGTSIALASQWADRLSLERVLIILADMPLVTTKTLAAIGHQCPPAGASACRHPDGRLGVPACFATGVLRLFANSLRANGAQHVLEQFPNVAVVEPAADELLDVDTPDDLRSAQDALGARLGSAAAAILTNARAST